ncbi:hypothetical protein pneo_cds_613 [Pandoravirus neocaledonia]|uniref:Uncharacterized protein n=1 Tax=Pandoravirus neocaledonia TaxID=2107708 RepID=A0A2U7UD15_9VIRU|nr:hypothetical protein pneo_cds_613 [Pandoravirus neocaledonia]AVK76220.1 hypothetical protein pneo_cds_613 [Pandoravirus neocaledonia]
MKFLSTECITIKKRKKDPDNDQETCANQTRFMHSDPAASANPSASVSATGSRSYPRPNNWFYPAIYTFVPPSMLFIDVWFDSHRHRLKSQLTGY